MPWTTLAILTGSLIILGGGGYFLYRLGITHGKGQAQRDTALADQERMRQNAEIAAQPYPSRPLDSLFK